MRCNFPQSVTCHAVNHKPGLLLESFTERRTDSGPNSAKQCQDGFYESDFTNNNSFPHLGSPHTPACYQHGVSQGDAFIVVIFTSGWYEKN